ncbi:MAG: site-2 protease family protein [Nitrospirae bacterium]|nr:site-2 protease family protein [Nitrospirota bacterium]
MSLEKIKIFLSPMQGRLLPLILFITTFLSTLAAGAFQKGVNLFKQPERIIEGLPFALSLMTILLFHEFSHYLASKKNHTRATLPYFIPAPSIVGTFGAFIKMKSPIITRKALIEIGASGPIIGFIISVIVSVIGLSMSTVVFAPEAEGMLQLGDSVLFSLLSRIVLGATPNSHEVLLDPVAFAGWIGLFITSLNLIPIGQLDGGHVAFAFLGQRHKHLSVILTVALGALGLIYWKGWLLWAILMLILGIKHPPVIYWEPAIDRKRRLIGLASALIFIITFTPDPFKIQF